MNPRVLLVVCLATAVHAETWTLDRAVATALEHSPEARLAVARIEGAQALVDQARSAWRPRLDLSSRYTETNSPMIAFGSILNQRAFNPSLDFNHPGRIDNLNATGTLTYNLYSGGRVASVRAARAGVEAADLDLHAAHQQLIVEVVRTALTLRNARAAVLALTAGVEAYDAAVSVAQARFDAGQILKADLLSLEVQQSQTRESLAAARHGAALATRTFRFVLGLDPSDEPVELVDDDPAFARLIVPDSAAANGRPDLQSLQARLRAAESLVASARAARHPSVNAFASYQYDQGCRLDRDATSWLAGVAVDVNVFDGGHAAGGIRQRRAEVTQLREMLRRATLGATLEIEQARLAYADALERREVSSAAVAQAEESAALTRARFEKQAVLVADVIGAESRLVEARLRRTTAEADERLSIVELRRALGLTPLPPP